MGNFAENLNLGNRVRPPLKLSMFCALGPISQNDQHCSVNRWQLAKMKKSIPDMSLP